MKTKTCTTCKQDFTVMYRVQIRKGKEWIFVCTDCCKKHQSLPEYRYGGTWKGSRHCLLLHQCLYLLYIILKIGPSINVVFLILLNGSFSHFNGLLIPS